jgi:hypothetical protein
MYLFFNEYTEEDQHVGYCNGCHIGGDSGGPPFPKDTPAAFRDFLLEHEALLCEGRVLVIPGDAAESGLVHVLEGDCPNGFSMPGEGFFAPTAEEIAGIKGWIAAGAEL